LQKSPGKETDNLENQNESYLIPLVLQNHHHHMMILLMILAMMLNAKVPTQGKLGGKELCFQEYLT
jgi:hypothetical protein